MIENISQELTPMVATARSIKKKHPNAKVVFIGPCASKKLEAMRRIVRSDVDFVVTFEELWGMFDAKEIDPSSFEGSNLCTTPPQPGELRSGRRCCRRNRSLPERILSGCSRTYRTCRNSRRLQKVLSLAKAGKIKGCLIEGMACPGGCMGGAGTNVPFAKSSKELKKLLDSSTRKIPDRELEEIDLS